MKAGSKVLEVLFSITFKAFCYGKTTRHSEVGRAQLNETRMPSLLACVWPVPLQGDLTPTRFLMIRLTAPSRHLQMLLKERDRELPSTPG